MPFVSIPIEGHRTPPWVLLRRMFCETFYDFTALTMSYWHNHIRLHQLEIIRRKIRNWFENGKCHWICWRNSCPPWGKCQSHSMYPNKTDAIHLIVSTNFRVFAPSLQTITQSLPATNLMAGGAWSTISVRTNIRDHFPRAKETKRVTVHGYEKRISTRSGRKIIMRRILKGRHVLSHWKGGGEAHTKCQILVVQQTLVDTRHNE